MQVVRKLDANGVERLQGEERVNVGFVRKVFNRLSTIVPGFSNLPGKLAGRLANCIPIPVVRILLSSVIGSVVSLVSDVLVQGADFLIRSKAESSIVG